jgi:hypothetical protein
MLYNIFFITKKCLQFQLALLNLHRQNEQNTICTLIKHTQHTQHTHNITITQQKHTQLKKTHTLSAG